MTYFPDGAPYTYSTADESARTVCVGWLDAAHEFPTAPTQAAFLVALGRLYATHRTAQTRGFHQCNVGDCGMRPPWPPVSVELHGQTLALGSAEIRVRHDDANILAAPDLIYHYVVVHKYAPPDYFVAAVMRGAADSHDPAS
jgi:hypothetical protein